MNTPVTLATLRRAISDFSRVTFCCEGMTVTADLYLLGNARKTGAYVVLAWCVDPNLGWQLFRFAQIRNFKIVGRFETMRRDYTASDPAISTLDTFLPVMRSREAVH